jgi:flagellar biosynthesis/type III secretory pathway protein FliH
MDAEAWKNSVEWGRHQSRLRLQRDQIADLKDAFENGFRQGLKEGAADAIRSFQRLLNLPSTPREELLALTLEGLKSRVAALETQLITAIR